MRFHAVLACLVAAMAQGKVVEMTSKNQVDLMEGKNSFVRFFASWCGYSKAMRPAWEKLADDYADSPSILIADVDCTGSGMSICRAYGIGGYPVLKSFKDGDMVGESYGRDLDYDSLKKFVVDNLEVECDIHMANKCTKKEQDYIEKMKVKSAEEISAQLNRLHAMKENSMNSELKRWLHQRIGILKQLRSPSTDEEL